MSVVLLALLFFGLSLALGLAGFLLRQRDFEHYRYVNMAGLLSLAVSATLVIWFLLSFR